MPGLSHTLDVARRAMAAQQSVLTVVGHNISNANTPGYTRQIGHLSTLRPSTFSGITYGNGVVFDSVMRNRSAALDAEYRNETSLHSYWDTRAGELVRLEQALGEPSDSGLAAVLDDYFSAWADLSNDPSATTRRATVREQGRVLSDRFRSMARQLTRMEEEIRTEIGIQVDQFNLTLSEIRDLTMSIRASDLRGIGSSDLLDKRDALLDELARTAEIAYGERENGDFYLRMDGKLIFDETTFRPLELLQDDRGAETTFFLRIGTGARVDVSQGSLGALFELHDETLPGFQENLDALAKGVIQNVNAIHGTGPSGADFFVGTGAADVTVSTELEDSLAQLNTSTSGLAGDNDIALALAELRDAKVMSGNTSSLGEFWNGVVGSTGVASREAQMQSETLTLTRSALEERREESGGVSLDEEMANLIQTQQAYIAAVRLFEIVGDMMDRLTSM